MSVQTEQQIRNQTQTNSQNPQSVSGSGDTPTNLIEIGRPIGIREDLDYNGILKKRILSKMSIIDLIPVDAGLNFLKAGESIINADVKGVFSSFIPQLTYKEAIDRFARICELYGLPRAAGVRLYLVDESTAVDEIRNEFSENILQGYVNQLSEMKSGLFQIGRSLSTQYDESVDKAAEELKQKLASIPLLDKVVNSLPGNIMMALGKMIVKGTRISLPKFWSSSQYQMQSSCVVKLVSPYGSPKAILNYIAKPLLALLLLASSTSDDGVSYGYPRVLTIYAYGLGKILVGAIDSLSIRRGGADTSFNKYRQPLSLDISITFTTIIDGYAAIDKKVDGEHDILSKFTDFVQDPTTSLNPTILPLLNTPGRLIDSLRPINFVDYQSDTNNGYVSLQNVPPQQEGGGTGEAPTVGSRSDPTSDASSSVRNEISNSANTGSITTDPDSLAVA